MKTSHLALAAFLGGVPLGTLHANTGANVQCWAPGMSNILTLNSYGQGVGVYVGRPFRYEIYGVAGRISLGNQVHNGGVAPNGRFTSHPHGGGNSANNHMIDSYSSVKLQVNWAQYYPRHIEVTGDRPGITYGPYRLYGESWVTRERFGYPETTLVFHLAGTQSHQYPNRNPYGYFYVVGEFHAVPPLPIGSLTIPKPYVLQGLTAPVGYTIMRTGAAESVPPFVDYDPNEEIIDGTAPTNPGGGTSPTPGGTGFPEPPGSEVIDLEIINGGGWVKIHNNRSGLADGTNPGRGSGRTNSPNQGTLNPGGLGQGLEPTTP